MKPVMFRGDIEVKYGGITVEDTPQKNPNMNLDIYITRRSKEAACTTNAIAIITSTKIMLFFYPNNSTIFPHTKEPTLTNKYLLLPLMATK